MKIRDTTQGELWPCQTPPRGLRWPPAHVGQMLGAQAREPVAEMDIALPRRQARQVTSPQLSRSVWTWTAVRVLCPQLPAQSQGGEVKWPSFQGSSPLDLL